MKSLLKYITEGAWGYEPDQNDGTLDLRGDIFFSICELIYDKCSKLNNDNFHTDYAWEHLGAIEYFFDELTKIDDFHCGDQEFGKYYYWWRLIDKKKTKNIVELYGKLLNICKNDEKWINGWKNPDEMRTSLQKREEVYNKYQKLLSDRNEYKKKIEKERKNNKGIVFGPISNSINTDAN